MLSSTVVTENVVLTLNGEEVKWLKNHMQNPLYDCHPDNENEKDARMRKAFWEALGGN